MKIIYLGEIVGKSGVYVIKKLLPQLRRELKADLVIANGEGVTGGYGLGKSHAIYLHKLGIDVLTGGEKIYFKRDLVEFLPRAAFLLRPANLPFGNPGRGWRSFNVGGKKLAVVALLGQSFLNQVHANNPFAFCDDLLKKTDENHDAVFIDFHAATTAEKKAFIAFMDGRVAAVIGSHNKVLTADAGVSSNGTAAICDSGRCGSIDSVAGFLPKTEIAQLIDQIPRRSEECWDDLQLQGVAVEINDSGRAVSIDVIQQKCPTPSQEDMRA